MENKDDLTSESVKKKFKSQFELVGYAIHLADNMIRTGRGPRVKSDSQNVAVHILDEIKAGVDKLEDLPKEVKHEAEVVYLKSAERKDSFKDEAFAKSTERKRPRKILAD